ncbi:hypothetical protein BMS3Bbin05_01151 [bacterium BMS3Bbin05]|nr:hypothetical protein BMS3Bbin05_01151 [bacterium BMS3Bbin05]
MKSKLILLILSVMLVFGATKAVAYNLDIVPATSVDVTGQTMFFVDVVFTPDMGGNTFGDYGFNLFYDNLELTWNSVNTILSPPSPLSAPFAPFEMSPDNGQVFSFSGSLPLTIPPTSDPTMTNAFTLATVAFSVDSPGVNISTADGFADVWFDITTAGTGFTINGAPVSMSSMPIGSMNTDVFAITVVPEPVSSALFIVGGATLGLRRFRKWKRQGA